MDIQPIEHCGIRCTAEALLEFEGGRLMVTIPRNEIQRIGIRYGIQAPHPMLQVILGLGLASVAYFPLRELIDWLRHGGTLFTVVDLLLFLPIVGAWTAWEALKRGYFFEVQSSAGIKRLAFAKKPQPAALDEMIAFIEQNYGIAVLREDRGAR
jgi:hypothetical protein